MLKLFEEIAGFSLGSLAQRDKFLPEPMPLESHKTGIDYAKFIGETWGKSTITIRIPRPNMLSAMIRDLPILKQQLTNLGREMDESLEVTRKLNEEARKWNEEARKWNEETRKSNEKTRKWNKKEKSMGLKVRGWNRKVKSMGLKVRRLKISADKAKIATKNRQAEDHSSISNLTERFNAMKTRMDDQFRTLTEDSIARNDALFRICRGNLLMDLVKKLLPEEAEKAGHRPTSTRWSTMAENYTEADFKDATQNFNVCNDSAQMMQIFQSFGTLVEQRNEAAHDYVDMARLLMTPSYREMLDKQFWRRLFEYVYDWTVEETVQRWNEIEEMEGLW